MKAFLLSLPFLLVVALIVHAQGSFSGFVVWNCLPVALAFVALVVGLRSRGPLRVARIAFAAVAAFIPALFHLAWMFDWGGTATGSSTSGLAFVFVPVWAVVLAAVGAVVSWAIARCLHHEPNSMTE